MTDHLPECVDRICRNPLADGLTLAEAERLLCCCTELRACEERVRQDEHIRTLDYVQTGNTVMNVFGTYYGQGYAAGVQAARDAVAALEPLLNKGKREGGYDCCGCSSPNDLYDDALAAIDALKEEKP